jgi:hypothetical protein
MACWSLQHCLPLLALLQRRQQKQRLWLPQQQLGLRQKADCPRR